MRKRFIYIGIAVLLVAAGLITYLVTRPFDPGCEKLSEMSDSKVSAFLDYYDIDIPEGVFSPDADIKSAVRAYIAGIEKNPANDPSIDYDYQAAHDFLSAIYHATLKYYGWDTAT